jgi:hypothetical protein
MVLFVIWQKTLLRFKLLYSVIFALGVVILPFLLLKIAISLASCAVVYRLGVMRS